MFRLLDAILDKVSSKLAENLSSNMEIVAKNKVARELERLSDPELRQAGLSRNKLKQGSYAYPWNATYNDAPVQELEKALEELHAKQQCNRSSTLAA